jgi:hypothetical protein
MEVGRAQPWRLGWGERDIVAAATMGNPLLVGPILSRHQPIGKQKSVGARSRNLIGRARKTLGSLVDDAMDLAWRSLRAITARR